MLEMQNNYELKEDVMLSDESNPDTYFTFPINSDLIR